MNCNRSVTSVERTSLFRWHWRRCSTTLSMTYTGLASFGRTCCHAPSQVLDELVKKTLPVQALLQAGCLPDAVQHYLPWQSLPPSGPNFLSTYLRTPCLCFQRYFSIFLAHSQPSAACKIRAVRVTTKGNDYKSPKALGHEGHLASWALALSSLRRWGSPSSHLRKSGAPGLIQPLPRTQEAPDVLAILGSCGAWRVQGAAPEACKNVCLNPCYDTEDAWKQIHSNLICNYHYIFLGLAWLLKPISLQKLLRAGSLTGVNSIARVKQRWLL